MTILKKLESIQQELVSFEMHGLAVSLQNVIEDMKQQEVFGYFKAEPFGWTDCAETDEGAKALYEHPPLSDETVKDGYVLVPVEPTEAMYYAGHEVPNGIGGCPPSVKHIYRAMIDEAMKADK